MKKHLLYTLLAITALACSSETPEERAAKAALSYYHHLAEGRPAAFLEGKAGTDSLPADYRQQLMAACQQYLTDMTNKHGGISHVEISPNGGRRDSSLQVTYAFLLLSFADSTQEEITVPMVEAPGGQWLMR